MGVDCHYFIFLIKRLRLAFFVLFGFFELFGEEAFTVAMHLGLVFIDAELICYHLLIDLIVGTHT